MLLLVFVHRLSRHCRTAYDNFSVGETIQKKDTQIELLQFEMLKNMYFNIVIRMVSFHIMQWFYLKIINKNMKMMQNLYHDHIYANFSNYYSTKAMSTRFQTPIVSVSPTNITGLKINQSGQNIHYSKYSVYFDESQKRWLAQDRVCGANENNPKNELFLSCCTFEDCTISTFIPKTKNCNIQVDTTIDKINGKSVLDSDISNNYTTIKYILSYYNILNAIPIDELYYFVIKYFTLSFVLSIIILVLLIKSIINEKEIIILIVYFIDKCIFDVSDSNSNNNNDNLFKKRSIIHGTFKFFASVVLIFIVLIVLKVILNVLIIQDVIVSLINLIVGVQERYKQKLYFQRETASDSSIDKNSVHYIFMSSWYSWENGCVDNKHRNRTK